MTWVVHKDKPHHCDPPMTQAYTDITFIDRCAVNSWEDIWKCDECGKHWVPKPSIFPFHSSWEELKGWKLKLRLRKART